MRKDIEIGEAMVKYNGDVDGWMLPGGTFTRSVEVAIRACELMNDYMSGAIRGGPRIIGVVSVTSKH